MLSDEPGDVPAPPSKWVSAYDCVRFRWRVLTYNLRLLRGPTVYETAGLAVGLAGLIASQSGLAAFGARLPALEWVLGLLTVVVLAALVRTLHRLSRLPTSFSLACGSQRLMERLREDMRDGMKNSAAFTMLERIYVPVVQATNDHVDACGGTRHLLFVKGCAGRGNYLAVAIPAVAGETLSDLVEPRVGVRPEPWRTWAATFAQERQDYMRELRRLRPKTGNTRDDDEDGDNLVLDRLSEDGSLRRLRLTTSVGTYGQIVRTSDSLINEFALFAHLSADRRARARTKGDMPHGRRGGLSKLLRRGAPIDLDGTAALRQLPWRRAVHPDLRPSASKRGSEALEVRLEDLLVRPTGRAAGIGVALTLIDADTVPENPTAYVAVRGRDVGTYPDVMHVLPAGMCNIKSSTESGPRQLPDDFVKWTMLGELLEEGKKVAEAEHCGTTSWIVKTKYHCMAEQVSTESPRFTGLAVDLLNLRPEICAVKEMPPGDPDRSQLDLNWEYNKHKGIGRVSLSTLQTECERTAWVQSGVASLALAAHHYEHVARQEDVERV